MRRTSEGAGAQPPPEEIYDLIIVGAGWSGLAGAKAFLQVRPDAKVLIVDSNATLGGTWSEERLYPHLRAEAGYGLFHFPDLQMDREHTTPEGWIEGPAVFRYLNKFAEKFGLVGRMMLGTSVEKITRLEETKIWRLQTSSSSGPGLLWCWKLIIATGLTSEPNVPEFPQREFKRPLVHSKELGREEVCQRLLEPDVRTVTVYGGSKSAFDTVYFLVKAGKYVEWVIRPDGGGPSLMTPRKMLGFISSFELNNTRFFGVFSPNVFDNYSLWYRLFHGPQKLRMADFIVTTFWKVTTWMLKFSAGYDSSDNGRKLVPSMGLESALWSPATLGVMTYGELWKSIHEGRQITVHRRTIKSLSDDRVILDDGAQLRSDALVFATGWKAKHTIFEDDQLGELGLPSSSETLMEGRWLREHLRLRMDAEVVRDLPLLAKSPAGYQSRSEDNYHLYRFIAPASDTYGDRSIAFIGFLRNTGLPIVSEAQALWATAYLLGELDLPSKEEREVEAARTSAWTRRRYVCGRKVPFALVDWFPYVDLLYRDLGVNSHRKGDWLSETFALYRPEDFSGTVAEWLEHRGKGKIVKSKASSGWVLLLTSAACIAFVLSVMVIYRQAFA